MPLRELASAGCRARSGAHRSGPGMSISRRKFLTAVGCCGVAWTLGGAARANGPLPVGDIALARHVLNRCTFGIRPGDLQQVLSVGVEAWVEAQLYPEAIEDTICHKRVRRLETLQCPVGELFEYKEDFLWKELATGKLLHARYSERQHGDSVGVVGPDADAEPFHSHRQRDCCGHRPA